jgi:Xaa-Pro aminopeptidase
MTDMLPLSDALRATSYRARIDRVRAAMRRDGYTLLIAYGTGQHSFVGMNPAWYLSGFRQMGPHAAVVIPLDDEPFLLMTPSWDVERARARSVVTDMVGVAPAAFLPALADSLRRRGLDLGRVAVAGGRMPREISEGWADTLGAQPASGETLISDIARIRDQWSLACTRRAVAIAEKGCEWLEQNARAGAREHQLVAALDVYMRGLGAEDNFLLMSSSQHNRSVHQPTRRLIAEGDILLSEITPAVEGEYIQICRSAVFGTPTALQLEKFALLDEALRAGMRAATPGTPVSTVVEAINAPIAAAGYGEYTVPPYMRTRGHSMALGSMDPEISMFSGNTLEEGMVFVMHPNQYLPDTGYLMCGEPVLITPSGAEPLTSMMGVLGSYI